MPSTREGTVYVTGPAARPGAVAPGPWWPNPSQEMWDRTRSVEDATWNLAIAMDAYSPNDVDSIIAAKHAAHLLVQRIRAFMVTPPAEDPPAVILPLPLPIEPAEYAIVLQKAYNGIPRRNKYLSDFHREILNAWIPLGEVA